MRATSFPARCLVFALALAAAACGEPAGVPPAEEPQPAEGRIEILHPLLPQEGGRLLAGQTRVQARCTDASLRCASLEVYVGGALVARGVDQVDSVISLGGVSTDSIRFRFVATTRFGARFAAESESFEVEPSPLWNEVFTVPGWLRDATLDRAIYSLDRDDQMSLREIPTGTDWSVRSGTNVPGAEVWLIPGGYLVSFIHVITGKPSGLYEIGGSNVEQIRGFNLAARGRWAAWVGDGLRIHRDDVLGPTLTSGSRLIGPGPVPYDLAEDGTIVYAGYNGIDEQGWDVDLQLFLLRPEGAETQLTFDTATAPLSPETDGTNVVYNRRAGAPDAYTYTLVLLTPAGEVVLAGPHPAHDPGDDRERPFQYYAEAGWVVWPTGPGDEAELRARTPSGEVRPLGTPGSRGVLRAMSPTGQIIVETGGRWYYAAAPDAPAVDIGRARRRTPEFYFFEPGFRWIGGKPYVIYRSSFFRIDV